MIAFPVKPDLSDCVLTLRRIATVLPFPRPAGKRDNIAPAGRARCGGTAAVQNSLGDVAQQYPAILFSIRRVNDAAVLHVRRLDPSAGPASAVLGNPAGATLSNHRDRLRPDQCSVQGSGFMFRKRNLISAQMLAEARAWANDLTSMEIQGPGDLEAAWRRLEARYGVPYSTFWSLRYRDDLKDIWASLHCMLRLAVEQERGRRAAQSAHRQEIASLLKGGLQ